MEIKETYLMSREELLAHIDRVEDKLFIYEQMFGADKVAALQQAFHLSESLALILLALADGRIKRKAHLHDWLYMNRPDMEQADLKIIDVFVHKLRKALPWVEINTIWGKGYQLIGGADVITAALRPPEPQQQAVA